MHKITIDGWGFGSDVGFTDGDGECDNTTDDRDGVGYGNRYGYEDGDGYGTGHHMNCGYGDGVMSGDGNGGDGDDYYTKPSDW
jgi:hypothetical protein